MSRRDLTDREWAVIQPPLPNKVRGVPWRDLPEECGHCTTVCNRYNRWSKKGAGCTFSMP